MIEKANRLLVGGRVEHLGEGIYNVVGDNGTYTVVRDYTGRVSCNCPGFVKNGKCSHAAAVLMLIRSSRKRRRRTT